MTIPNVQYPMSMLWKLARHSDFYGAIGRWPVQKLRTAMIRAFSAAARTLYSGIRSRED